MTDDRSNMTNINFWLKNVMNISEATRQNKLADILESYATKKSRDIYVIQNSKKKEAAGVLSSVEYHLNREQIIERLEDEVLRLADEIFKLKVQLRQEQPVYTFAQAIEKLGFDQHDLADIFKNADEVEID